MSPEQLAALRVKHDAYIDRAVQRGYTAVTYKVPCCGAEQRGIAQPPDTPRQWDTLTTCSACGALYMKITRGGVITAVLPPKE